MADSKIDFSFENLHFSCEGDNDWVEKQLNNVLNRIPALLAVHKKNENIVEEVIEVSEEIAKEEAGSSEQNDEEAVAASKVKKPRSVKVPKVSLAKAGNDQEENDASGSGQVAENVTAKRGRKSKEKARPTAKAKSSKKKAVKMKPVTELPDSPIAQFIAEKKATGNQVRKFLATAVFLAKSNNVSRLSTPMISRALKSYGIEKLQNASDCLNKNEKKGYCIKEGKEFVITENGYLSIG